MKLIVLGKELCLHHLNPHHQVYTESLSTMVESFQILIFMQSLRMPVSAKNQNHIKFCQLCLLNKLPTLFWFITHDFILP